MGKFALSKSHPLLLLFIIIIISSLVLPRLWQPSLVTKIF